MNTDIDSWKNVRGEKLKLPFTKEPADSVTPALDSGGEKTGPHNGLTRKKESPLLSTTRATHKMSAPMRNTHPDARVTVAGIPAKPERKFSKLCLPGYSGPYKRRLLRQEGETKSDIRS